MKMLHSLSAVALALILAPADTFAQEDAGDLEATIRLMDEAEAERPDAVTREITLPLRVDDDSAAVKASAEGLDTANEARQHGRGIGEEARENAAADALEQATEMAEAARENAENRSRADEFRPDPPDPPDTPGPPDNPGPPDGGQ